jgi:hypothetical protein
MAAVAVSRAAAAPAAPRAQPFARLSLQPSCFSVDLVASALAQRDLLRAVHAVPRGALYEARAQPHTRLSCARR